MSCWRPMVSRFPWFRWLAALVLAGRLAGQVESAPNQAWVGVWAGELPEYGTVVLKVSSPAQDKPLRFDLWWLFDDVNLPANNSAKAPSQPRLEDGTLYLARLLQFNYSDKVGPGVAFNLSSPDEMRLASYGVLHPIMPPIWANLVLRKDPTGQAWNERKKNSAKLTGGKLTDQHGNIVKPLPVSWAAEVVMPTTLLFSHHSFNVRRCLAETRLPVDFLRTICAMAQEVGPGASFTLEAWRTLAANPHTPTEILDKVWAHPDELRAWYLAAANPNARPEWRAELVDRVMRGGDRLKTMAVNAETGPDELYRRLIADSAARRSELAASWQVPGFVHELLARDYAAEVGDVLAQNDGVPAAVLDTLAGSTDRQRRIKLLGNKSLRPETKARLLRELVATATWRDYRHLAYQENVPPGFLAKCAEDPDSGVRISVLRNPSTSQTTLIKLTGDESTSVAWQAYEKLQERFPGTPGIKPPSVARKAADFGPTVEEQCIRAVAANDQARLAFLLGYLRDYSGRTFPYIAAKLAPEALKEYRPECMDLILAGIPDRKEGLVVNLAESSAQDARWKAYFKGKGAFAGEAAGRRLQEALGNNDRLAKLLADGFDPKSNPSLLHIAVRMRDPAAVELLLKAGADPGAVDGEKLTALDYAVREMMLPAIVLLDRTGSVRDRMDSFIRTFPPAPDSRLQGIWSRSEYPAFTLVLYPDGVGVAEIYYAKPMRIGWRPSGTDEAVGTKLTEEGKFGPEMTITLRLAATGNELDVTIPGQSQAIRLKRRPAR